MWFLITFGEIILLFSLLSQYSLSENKIVKEKTVRGSFQGAVFSTTCNSSNSSHCKDFRRPSLLEELIQSQIALTEEIKNFDKLKPGNCYELLKEGFKESGVYVIYPFASCENIPMRVYCDQDTDGGGWTRFQHRDILTSREDFMRNWVEYELGFGDINGEFWLGLENIRTLAMSPFVELRVDMEDFGGEKRWAKYRYFYISSRETGYKLVLGSYSGDAGDSLSNHIGYNFSTLDRDNDDSKKNCAAVSKGGWWYHNCHSSNLNGYQREGDHATFADGINWKAFRGFHHSLKVTSMSLRPVPEI